MNHHQFLAIIGGLFAGKGRSVSKERGDGHGETKNVAAPRHPAEGKPERDEGFFPVADTDYEYAFRFSHFLGAAESADLALDAIDRFERESVRDGATANEDAS